MLSPPIPLTGYDPYSLLLHKNNLHQNLPYPSYPPYPPYPPNPSHRYNSSVSVSSQPPRSLYTS